MMVPRIPRDEPPCSYTCYLKIGCGYLNCTNWAGIEHFIVHHRDSTVDCRDDLTRKRTEMQVEYQVRHDNPY